MVVYFSLKCFFKEKYCSFTKVTNIYFINNKIIFDDRYGNRQEVKINKIIDLQIMEDDS